MRNVRMVDPMPFRCEHLPRRCLNAGWSARPLPAALCWLALTLAATAATNAQAQDPIRDMQRKAIDSDRATWGHWGPVAERYSSWTSHSNRLIPTYTFGFPLKSVPGLWETYSSPARLMELFGQVPPGTLKESAEYFDQTDLHRWQLAAVAAGKKRVIVVIFDGLDWPVTQAAASYALGRPAYDSGRGTGLTMQDYQGVESSFGYCVTSAFGDSASVDVDRQIVSAAIVPTGGFDAERGGRTPWDPNVSLDYLIGKDRLQPHCVTDSASSATSIMTGMKTYNEAINFDALGRPLEPIARRLQRDLGWSIGVVTSVPISHATPAAAYAQNVSRDDYQDLTRDLLGLPSIQRHPLPLPGVDVLLGAGWGIQKETDKNQGQNYVPGNRYLADSDLEQLKQAGPYSIALRTPGKSGTAVLVDATQTAIAEKRRLFGFFGGPNGHLPFATADGRFDPTPDKGEREEYTPADISENPSLADMTRAALDVLERDEDGFWLLVEAGDVDWACHSNNLDNAIGAVLSGDRAVGEILHWVESRHGWEDTAVLVTADHGHLFVLRDLAAIAAAGVQSQPPPTTAAGQAASTSLP